MKPSGLPQYKLYILHGAYYMMHVSEPLDQFDFLFSPKVHIKLGASKCVIEYMYKVNNDQDLNK